MREVTRLNKNILIVVGITILFLGVGIQPAFAEENKENNNQEEVPIFGFCILRVWTYKSVGGALPSPFTVLICEDLDTGNIRNRTSGFFGYKFFIGLRRGHTYKITAPKYKVSVNIELLDFWNTLDMEVWRF